MKKPFILFSVTLMALAPVCFAQASPTKPAKSASNEAAITDLEKSAWESYKDKQADAFRKLMSKDYYGTYAEDIKNLDREVADMAKTDLRDLFTRRHESRSPALRLPWLRTKRRFNILPKTRTCLARITAGAFG